MKAPYMPELNMDYPGDPFEHMIPPVKQTELVLDERYPFLDKSLGFRFRSAAMYLGIFVLVFILSPLRFGLKIRGRDILRKNRRLLKNGALTASNHVQRWDLLFVLQAVRYRRLWFPAWKENLLGPDRFLIRQAGGIPVPEDIHSIRYFNQAFDELNAKHKWFHVFPESARWDYYVPVRPFKKGMFTMAYKYKLPVIPMGFSYRKPHFPYTLLNKLRKKNLPLITLTIGEPLLPDSSLPRKEAVQLLRKECHKRIVELAGIEDNPWPAEGD
ncbi:MAG: 1-acyl-sn-glycerol-3-phosphate acyltransferase [Treponema sp.]|jgi:1-acyl-sn-glycerol-3-phosphate acyltransferase|nr:1-acyl-sn-glycerol-3-phosphate acyltransferase [Treponema sp.]